MELAWVAGPSTGPEPVTSCFPLASVSIHPKVPWPIRLRPPSVEMVLDLIERRCSIIHVSETCCSNFCSSRLGPGVEAASLERDRCGVGGVTWTVVPRDAAVSGYWELTVAGIEKVVIRKAGRHTLKVVKRLEERTDIA